MTHTDTIAAISSSTLPSARIILRISGPRAPDLARVLCPAAPVSPGHHRSTLAFAGLSFPIHLYLFRSPRSYTAEDLAEFHIPGNPLLARMLLSELLHLGTRAAEPGEFTARAYFNGRLTLEQAEGVAATIAAHNQQELTAAQQLAVGELSRRVASIMDDLVQSLALVEVGIDFSEEDVTFISSDELRRRIDAIDAAIANLIATSARLERLSHEPTFVLVGRPSAGKSTLLNALAGHQRAVVSPIPGTTRDILSAEIPLDRGLVRLIDLAGLEETAPSPADTSPHAHIARQMHEHALRAIAAADFVILVHDCTDPRPPLALPRTPDLIIHTKCDLVGARHAPPSVTRVGAIHASPSPHLPAWPMPASLSPHLPAWPMPASLSPQPLSLPVSAHTSLNLDLLRSALGSLAFSASSPALAINARHLAALDASRAALARARQALSASPEIIALELRDALDNLGQIAGALTPDDILARVFSSFCIGK